MSMDPHDELLRILRELEHLATVLANDGQPEWANAILHILNGGSYDH